MPEALSHSTAYAAKSAAIPWLLPSRAWRLVAQRPGNLASRTIVVRTATWRGGVPPHSTRIDNACLLYRRYHLIGRADELDVVRARAEPLVETLVDDREIPRIVGADPAGLDGRVVGCQHLKLRRSRESGARNWI